jgi:hypothetical protein
MKRILRTISRVMTEKSQKNPISQLSSQAAMELFLFHPIRSAAAAMVLWEQFICPPCVFCHHSLQCSWVRRARSLSLHLATQLNIGQRQPSGRGLFTKIHFDLWLRWRIVCCWRRRRRRGQAHTVHTHTRARRHTDYIHTAVWSPQRARSLI